MTTIVLPIMIFSCGGFKGKEQEEIEDLLGDDDARSVSKPRYFGVGKDIDPTLIPHNLGDTSRVTPNIKVTDDGVVWNGEKISAGTRLGYVEGELGEEGVFLTHYNTHVGLDGWYAKCKQDANYNIIVNPKGAIISVKDIFPGQVLLRK